MANAAVSKAKREDLSALVKMYKSTELKAGVREARWFVRCYFDYHHILVAKVDGTVRGACFWRIEGEEQCGLAWVENLWVEESCRRKGLGGLLLRRTLEDMRGFYAKRGIGLRRVMLTTQSERSSARRLYRRIGFEPRARLGDVYDPCGKDLVYVMEIDR